MDTIHRESEGQEESKTSHSSDGYRTEGRTVSWGGGVGPRGVGGEESGLKLGDEERGPCLDRVVSSTITHEQCNPLLSQVEKKKQLLSLRILHVRRKKLNLCRLIYISLLFSCKEVIWLQKVFVKRSDLLFAL